MPRLKVQRDRRQGGWVSRRSLLNRLSSSYPHHGERAQGPHPLGRGKLQHTPSRQKGKPCEPAVTLVAEGESERFVNVSAPTRKPCSEGRGVRVVGDQMTSCTLSLRSRTHRENRITISGLVKMSATCSADGWYSTEISPSCTNCLTAKYLVATCFVRPDIPRWLVAIAIHP